METLLSYLPWWLLSGLIGSIWWMRVMRRFGCAFQRLWVPALVYIIVGPVALWTAYVVAREAEHE